MKQRERHRLKTIGKTFGDWKLVTPTEDQLRELPLLENAHAIYVNNRYEVVMFACESPGIGGIMQCNIRRHGDLMEPTWADCQRVKNELFGPEGVAIEIYPKQNQEWKTAACVKVIWVMPTNWVSPVGLEMPNAWGWKG